MSISGIQPREIIPPNPEAEIVPSEEDLKVTRLIVAVHGIGSQYRYSTVQAVASRFAAYCGKPITQPLGAFHPEKMITEPDSAELGAYLFEPPKNSEQEFAGFGFAEVFWADIPERAAESNNTTEETKAWAQTVVERVRRLDQSGADTTKSTKSSNLIDYKKAGAVVEEMIGTIKVLENLLFIATKAGLFEFKLGQLLTDFLGDVQIVADFKDYGGDIFKRFADTMRNLIRRLPEVKEIYIIAHSEGTVVSFKGLLTALAAKEAPDNSWIKKVKGYMTIGSPLNKHIVMWPNLWKGLVPHPGRVLPNPILWRNYYDYGDPVGFNLEITRDWLIENHWQSEEAPCFQFEREDDYGFTRYPFPGKAHNDYWNDDKVFGHFITEVVLGKGENKSPKPPTIWWAVAISKIIPYIICLALLAGGTYVLYKTLVTVFRFPKDLPEMIMDVSGITSLLAGITLLSRMPRLDKLWPGGVIGLLGFVFGISGYLIFTSRNTQTELSSAFWPPGYGLLLACFLIALVSALLGKWRPDWGMIPLVSLGGIAAFAVLLSLLHKDSAALNRSIWPLLLANAGFLYLWWLSAMVFDLVYIWHRFISSYRTTITLSTLRKEAPFDLRA
jgi:hypothetical protein